MKAKYLAEAIQAAFGVTVAPRKDSTTKFLNKKFGDIRDEISEHEFVTMVDDLHHCYDGPEFESDGLDRWYQVFLTTTNRRTHGKAYIALCYDGGFGGSIEVIEYLDYSAFQDCWYEYIGD